MLVKLSHLRFTRYLKVPPLPRLSHLPLVDRVGREACDKSDAKTGKELLSCDVTTKVWVKNTLLFDPKQGCPIRWLLAYFKYSGNKRRGHTSIWVIYWADKRLLNPKYVIAFRSRHTSNMPILSHKVKTQYLHIRSHAGYFLLSWKIPEVMSRRSILFHNLKVLDQITFLTTRFTSSFLRFWYQ